LHQASEVRSRVVAGLCASLIASLIASVSTPALADEQERGAVYQLNPLIDIPVLALGLAGTSAALLEVDPVECVPNCEIPDQMPGIDRTAIGKYNKTSGVAADVISLTFVLGPPVWSAIDTGGDGLFEDVVVHTETVLVMGALTQLVKFAVQRPGPWVYDPNVPLEDQLSKDNARVFWSGHTATAFASATTHAVTYWLRHPRDPWRFTVLATDMAAATAMGILVYDAGWHYPTDVVAGALAGASIGVLVPMLHTDF
jgi:membrane-associated phospholipid phosphatase